MSMSLPNKITLFRILMIPVFAVLFFVEFEGHTLAAACVFALACMTDFIDGYIARKNNLVTAFGKFLDPIADKMIVACALIAICITPPYVAPQNVFAISVAVCTMIILMRELMISGFRTVAANKGVVLPADMIGKIKTWVQMSAIFALIPVPDFANWNHIAALVFYYAGFGGLVAATLLTLISGAHYLIKNREVLKD